MYAECCVYAGCCVYAKCSNTECCMYTECSYVKSLHAECRVYAKCCYTQSHNAEYLGNVEIFIVHNPGENKQHLWRRTKLVSVIVRHFLLAQKNALSY